MNDHKAKMEPASTWEGRYQAGKPGWERDRVNAALLHWLGTGMVSPPAHVLVPGCGRSPEALHLANLGFSVTGIDFAPSAIAGQKAALQAMDPQPDVQFLQADMFEYWPDAPVDLVYEQTCLCALNPHLRTDYEAQIHQWLKPGGKLLALFMQTGNWGGPPYDCPMQAMRQIFPEVRWQWPEAEPFVSEHTNGKNELAYVLIRK